MKLRLLSLSLFATVGAFTMNAQKGIDTGTPFGSGEDSIRCRTNISLFVPYAKSGNFKDAAEFWEIVYKECPASSRNVYVYASSIIRYQMSQETDPAKKQALIDKLMGVYDSRIKYFGDDERYPEAWIYGNKALDYADLMGDKADKNLLYDWYGKAVTGLRENVDPNIFWNYMQLIGDKLKAGQLTSEQFLEIYEKNSEILDAMVAASDNEEKTKFLSEVKDAMSGMLVSSGAADCTTLQNIYGPKIEANKTNAEFLKNVVIMLRKVGCTDAEAYMAAAEYMHKIEPTAESAAGMAGRAYKRDDLDEALKYFEEAVQLAQKNEDKADYLFSIAAIYTQKKNYSKAREYARRSADLNPKSGKPYILIAKLYASDANNIYPNDPIMAQVVFYAAIDKLEKARQVDASSAEEANKLIASYRSHLPKTEDIFMHGDLQKGKSVTIGGWIQENVVIR